MAIKEEQFHRYLDIAGSFIISINKEQIITYINQRGAEILGYPVSEIIGQDYFDLCVDPKLHEISRKRFCKLFEIDFIKPNNFEGKIFTANGENRIINWTNSALRNDDGEIEEIISSGNDITWRIQMLRKSLQRERKYRTLIETTDTGYSIVDAAGNLLEANGKYVQLAGYDSLNALRGKNVLQIIAAYNREKYKKNIQACLETKKVMHYEIDIITPQKQIIPIQMSSKAISKRGSISIMTLCRDITQQRQIEAQSKLHEQQLIQADKMASLGILVSGVAHEINNPNNFVMLNIPILQTMWKSMEPILDQHWQENGDFLISKRLKYSQVKSTIPELLQGIYDGSTRIKNIVQELKDYARLEDNGNMEIVSINEVIETAIVLTSNLIKQTTYSFQKDLQPNIPAIMGNFQKLEQVMINLLENSCQAITDKAKKLSISSRYEAESQSVVCTISDEGEGMSAETQEKIFDPFFTTKRTKGGTGLGLSVSSKIIKHHHGEISYSSKLQKGTTVTIKIPQYQREKQGDENER